MDDDDIVDILRGLVESAGDGERDAAGAAAQARDNALRHALRLHASQCQQAAAELRALLALYGAQPDESAAPSLRRAEQRRVRERIGLPDEALAEQVQHTQAHALPRYRRALATALPCRVRLTVDRQHGWLQHQHLHLSALRERLPRRPR